MCHGVYGEMLPNGRSGGGRAPVEGEVNRGQAPGEVPRGVLGPKDRKGGEGGREAGRRRVVSRRGASNSKGGEAPSISAIRSNGREASFPRED